MQAGGGGGGGTGAQEAGRAASGSPIARSEGRIFLTAGHG